MKSEAKHCLLHLVVLFSNLLAWVCHIHFLYFSLGINKQWELNYMFKNLCWTLTACPSFQHKFWGVNSWMLMTIIFQTYQNKFKTPLQAILSLISYKISWPSLKRKHNSSNSPLLSILSSEVAQSCPALCDPMDYM